MFDTHFVAVPTERPVLDDEPRFTQDVSELLDRRIRKIHEFDLSAFTTSGSKMMWGFSNPLDFSLGFFFCSVLNDFSTKYFEYFGLKAEKQDYLWLRGLIFMRIKDMRKSLEEALTNNTWR